MAASTTYTIQGSNGGLIYDGKKALTVTTSYGSSTLNVADLVGATYGADAKGNALTLKGGTITDVNASALKKTLTIVGSNATPSSADKSVNVTLSSSGGVVYGGNKGDKFFGSSKADTFAMGAGDQIGDSKASTVTAYGKNDVVSIAAAFDELTFSDAPGKKTVTITDSKKNKYTIVKDSADRALNLITMDKVGSSTVPTAKTHTYGTDGSNTFIDTKGNITISGSSSNTVEVANIAAAAKVIDATRLSSGNIYLKGNGVGNNISLGAGVGTVYGGYNYDPTKAIAKDKNPKSTADNFYSSADRDDPVVFYFDSVAGSDNIYGYKSNDTIKIAVGVSSLNFDNNKVLKDGGAGKDVAITYYNSKDKLTVKNNTADLIHVQFVSLQANGSEVVLGGQHYGVDFSTVGGDNADVGLNAKRTAITISGAPSGTIGLEGWSHTGYTGNASDKALSFATKLNEIDASAATVNGYNLNTNLVLKAHSTLASVLRAANSGSTTMIGGKGADQFYGGSGHDAFVIDITPTATNTTVYSVGKDVINSINNDENDIVVLRGYNSTLHSDVVVDSKGVITFTDNATDKKNNNVTVKTFKPSKNATAQQVVVVDEKTGKILAVNSNSGAPAQLGMNVTAKAGLTTDDDFNGLYETDAYVPGATLNVSTGIVETNVNSQLGLIGQDAKVSTLDANYYGGTTKAIHAETVKSTLQDLYIKGNEDNKNAIYAPIRTSANDYESTVTVSGSTQTTVVSVDNVINVTLEGGKGIKVADTFYHDKTADRTNVTYIIDAVTGGKDVIDGYMSADESNANEGGDTIQLGVAASLSTTALFQSYLNDGKITEKGSDVIVTFDKNNVLTLKNAATKAVHFVDAAHPEWTFDYGKTLPSGLEYDSKRTAITAVASISATNTNSIYLADPKYYTGIKTVNLASVAGSSSGVKVVGNTVANELYADTTGTFLYGGSIRDSQGAIIKVSGKELKATADKLYGGVGEDTFAYMVGDGGDAIGNTKKGNESTLFDAKDVLVLSSDTASDLTRSDVTITDKKNVLTITIGDSKDKFVVNKATDTTPVNIVLAHGLDSQGSFESTTDSFIYGMDDSKFQGSLDLNKGGLTISGGAFDGTTTTTVDGSEKTINTYSTLADAELRNVASGLKNILVTAASDTAVKITGDSMAGNALNVTMGAGGGTFEGGARYDAKKGSSGFKDSVVLNNAASKGTTFVLSSVSGADQISNYDASRGDTIYFKDGLDKVEVAVSKKGIQFSYDSKNYVLINAANVNSDFDVRVCGKQGTSTTVFTGTVFGWDTTAKSSKLTDYLTNKRDTTWKRPGIGDTFIYDDGSKQYTLTSGSLQDTDGNYVPDGVSTVSGTPGLSFGVNYYVNPLVGNFHIAGTDIVSNTSLIINNVTYNLQDADSNTTNGYELSSNGFVKTGSDQVVYYGLNSSSLDIDGNVVVDSVKGAHHFTLTGALTDHGGETTLIGNSTVPTEITTGYLDKFSVKGYEVSINAASDTDLSNAHIELPAAVASVPASVSAYTLKIGTSSSATEGYKLYDGDGDASNGFELLRTDAATAAGWKLLTGADDVTSAQSAGTGVWQYTDTNARFLVSAADAVMPDEKGLPEGITVESTSSLTTVTFDNGFSIANKGFGKTEDNDFIYHGSLNSDGSTVVDYKTYNVGDSNQFTLSGVINEDDDNPLQANLANFNFAATSKLIITDSVTPAFDTTTHLKFSTDYLESVNDSVVAIAGQTIAIKNDNSVIGSYKLYDGDGNTANGSELIRTDVATKAGWSLLTGVQTDDRVTDNDSYALQSNGTGFWKFTSGSTVGYTFTVSSEAGLAHTDDGLPIGVSVTGGTTTGLTINVNSAAGIAPSHFLFGSDATFGSETKAVHISGYDVGTEFIIGEDKVAYQVADLDRDSTNGYELLKVDKNSGWSISEGAWTFDNKTIVYNNQAASDASRAAIPQVKFTIASDAGLAISDKGLPVGVNVVVENEVTSKYLGQVTSITIGTETIASHISFDTLGNSDIEEPTHIYGISSGTGTVPTFKMGDDNEYYLVNLDGKDNGLEFLRKDAHWLRTNSNWRYFNDSSTAAFNANGDFQITTTALASADGTPRGINVERKVGAVADTTETFITVDSALGTIADTTGTKGAEKVEQKPVQLLFSNTTVVNSKTGFHLFANGDESNVFKADATVSVVQGTETHSYLLADLDRDSTNGYELLHVNDANWTYNNGADTLHPVGSWSYSSGATVGSLTGGIKFDISATANLLGEGATLGTPSGVTVTAATTEDGTNMTITGAKGLDVGQFVFDSSTAVKTFLSNGGLHFKGADTVTFKAGQTIIINTPTTEDPSATSTYQLAELSGNTNDGLELLKIAPSTLWTLDVDNNNKRTWTYSNSGLGIDLLTISTDSNLVSTNDGTPAGITISGGNTAATISIDSGTAAVEASNVVVAGSLTFSAVDSDTNLGSGGTLHMVGVTTDTTIVIGSGTDTYNYVLAQMDTVAGDLEFLKTNANWKLYSQPATVGSDSSSTTYAAGTWVYTDANLTMTFSSEAGLVESARHIAPAGSDGAPLGVTVDGNNISLNRTLLNIDKDGKTAENFNGNITLGSNATIGKNGLHFDGVDSDTNIAISGSAQANFYFAELDNDSDNGYELTPWNNNWHRTADGWNYTDTSIANHNVVFTINDTIDVVEKTETDVVKSLVGSPQGITISASGETFQFSDTITFGTATDAGIISFSSVVAGVDGLHVKGITIDSEFAVGSKTYALKELTNDSSTGLELLVQDDNWSLANKGDHDEKRVWTYASDTGLSFSVGYNDKYASGLTLISSDVGQPVGASVSVDGGQYYINFAASGTGVTDLVSLDIVTLNAADDITKIHIKGFADSSTTNGSSYAYTTDTTKMFSIGTDTNTKYYLADVDGKADNGYELVKNDENWHRYDTGWLYNDSVNSVYFRIDSGTTNALLEAKSDYSGIPVGVSVDSVKASSNLSYQNITIDTGTKVELVFSTDTAVSDTRITYVDYATNPNHTLNADKAAGTATFQFAKFTNASVTADGPETGESKASTTYYLAHTDPAANVGTDTWAFVRRDEHWTRFDNGWLYTDNSSTGTNFSFFVTSTNPTVKADGTPMGFTVNSDTRVITIDSDTAKFGGGTAKSFMNNAAAQLVFFKDNKIGTYKEAGSTSTHVVVTGYENDGAPVVRWFNADSSAGVTMLVNSDTNVIGTGNATQPAIYYQLRNADADTTNGVELTFNGWAATSVGTVNTNTYLYQNGWSDTTSGKTSYTSFIVSGSAFATVNATDDAGRAGVNINGFEKAVVDGITFGDSSTVITKFDAGNFKVYGSSVTKAGSIGPGSTVKAYIDSENTVTFTLKNAVGATDDALMLTNEGWAKTINGSAENMIYSDSNLHFTLTGASTLDSDNDLLPDVMQKDGHRSRFETTSNGLSVSVGGADIADSVVTALRFSIAGDDASTKAQAIAVSVYDSTSQKYSNTKDNNEYQLTLDSGQYRITLAATESEELPASDGWTATGYDIDDLLGGTTGSSAATVSELDDILDVKPLGTETSTTFDPDAAFTEVGTTDKTINALLGAGARHKARK